MKEILSWFTKILVLLVFFGVGQSMAKPYQYLGGEVVSNPEIVVVYWGTQPPGLNSQLDRFYSQIVSSNYFNLLAEYNTPQQTIGIPRFIGSFQINQGRRAKAIDTVAIARGIDQHILSGRLPQPNANTIYMVHFGRSTPPAMGTNILGNVIGANVGEGFCAYHFTARTQVPITPPALYAYGPKLRIAVVPEASGISGCTRRKILDSATYLATHELVETITNPDSVIVGMLPLAGETLLCNNIAIPQVLGAGNANSSWAWASTTMNQLCNPNEIADQCGSASFKTSGGSIHTVTQMWQNSAGVCTVQRLRATPCGNEGQRVCQPAESPSTCRSPSLVASDGMCVRLACGRENERPCTVPERIPSCDSGLFEIQGRCQLPSSCGSEGQPECPVAVTFPSCRSSSLVASGGMCVHPACGRENERPCTVVERIPSCDSGLVEIQGTCQLPSSCGNEGQPECPVWVAFPSCRSPNLVNSGGVCVHPACGRNSERPCTVDVRIPSCDEGLRETGWPFNPRCVP